MKKIAILSIFYLALGLQAINAQDIITTEIENNSTSELNSVALANAAMDNDTIKNQSKNEVILKSTTINIPNSGGTVTIVTDETGQVRKTVFEIPSKNKTRRSSNYPRYEYSSYIDLGFNRIDDKNLFTGDEDISSSAFPKLNNNKSVSFALYPIIATYRPIKFVGLSSGVGIEWFNLRFNGGMSLINETDFTTAAPAWQVFNFDENSNVAKSKLTASYLNVPVMMQFYFSNYGSFRIMAGATFGVNIGSHLKVKYSDNNGSHKSKLDDDLNLSNFRYGFTARVNWDWLSIYANYYMTPLFKDGKGPKVYPFVVGVSLNFHDVWW